jgi:hypothetical protein
MKATIISLALFLIILVSCQKNKESAINKSSLTGFVQKGPFSTGSSVTLNELNSDLSQTGKNYLTQITNNIGHFQITDIALASQLVQ